MKPLSMLLCGATAISCASAGGLPPADPGPAAPPVLASDVPDDVDAPEVPVRAYFRASDSNDSRYLRQAFHPAAQLVWADDQGELKVLTQLAWWQRFDPTAAPQPAADRRLTILDREGPFALIEAYSIWSTHGFDDFLLVVETPDGWRIVGKVFERLPPGQAAPAAPDVAAEPAIRAILETKIAAHAAYDPRLLHASHTPACLYVAVNAPVPFLSTVSEAAWRYAARRDAGETAPDSRWRILDIAIRGRIAAAKLDVVFEGRRYIDHLLLVRLAEGWRIAAAAWGDPTRAGR